MFGVRCSLRYLSSRSLTRTASGFAPKMASSFSTSAPLRTPSFAFAFDIDGVLIHDAHNLPGAAETLRYLGKNRIPYILLTNGGGKLERDRVADLSARLDVPISIDNYVQSHTPFQSLVNGSNNEVKDLRDKTVFVTGSNAEACRRIAEDYGFKNVVTPADLVASQPAIVPLGSPTAEVLATARPLPRPVYNANKPVENPLKFDAVFVFHDPIDWSLDIQLITDIISAQDGVLGTYAPPGTASKRPTVYFSSGDLLWASSHPQPRMGQGAFRAALEGVWARMSNGEPLPSVVQLGKPYRETYLYAERILNEHREKLHAKNNGTTNGTSSPSQLKTVYMVGDNPASDIRGANEYESPLGTEWTSVLVRTGVWNPAREAVPAFQPKQIADNVQRAVEWALKREGWSEGIEDNQQN